MKIRRVMARKGDTPEYVNKMQQEVFQVLAESSLRRIEPKALEVYRGYTDGLGNADVRELAIHRRVSRLKYSRRCAEALAVQAHMKQGLPLAPGMEIGYVIRDAHKWEVDPEPKIGSLPSSWLPNFVSRKHSDTGIRQKASLSSPGISFPGEKSRDFSPGNGWGLITPTGLKLLLPCREI